MCALFLFVFFGGVGDGTATAVRTTAVFVGNGAVIVCRVYFVCFVCVSAIGGVCCLPVLLSFLVVSLISLCCRGRSGCLLVHVNVSMVKTRTMACTISTRMRGGGNISNEWDGNNSSYDNTHRHNHHHKQRQQQQQQQTTTP